MAYTKLDFSGSVTDIGGKIAAAKSGGTYTGNETDWDKRMVDALTKLLDQATAQNDKANQLIVSTHADAKKWVDASTELVKKKGKKVSVDDVGVLENAQRLVAKFAGTLSSDSQDLMVALQDFRGSWPGDAKKVMFKPERIDPLIAGRKKTIDENVQTEALKTRVKEYDTRMTSMVAVARKVAGQSTADSMTVLSNFSRDVAKSLALANKAAKQPAIDLIIKLNPKAKLAPADLKFHQENLASFQALCKNWHGALKTSEKLIADFKKVSGDFTGAAKQGRDSALAKAAIDLKAAIAKIKTVDALETKAAKNLQTVAKLR